MHEVLVNRLGGLSLPRKSVVKLTDRPDMTLDVYRGRKTTIQQYNNKVTMLQHYIYYPWQIVSETCRHGIVISANNTCIVFFRKYRCALLLYNNFVILLQSSIFAGSVMFKTLTESKQMTYFIVKHRIKENADVNFVTTPS